MSPQSDLVGARARRYRELFSRNRLNCRNVLQSPYANFTIRMSGVRNALSFNNALIASIICRSEEALTWRPVDGIDARTTFYLSVPEVLSGAETQLLVQNSFTTVTAEAVSDLGWLNSAETRTPAASRTLRN